MRKELFFAIFAGGILGIIIAFGIWRVNSSAPKDSKTTQAEKTPSETPINNFSITLAKIENNDVITDNPLTITGLTSPLSLVAISGESKDYLTDASESGEFTKDINLDGGINRIIFNAFAKNGNISELISTLVYSSEFAKYLTSSDSANINPGSVRDKVQQKVDEALKKPKAYIGSITDISELTIQIKSSEGEILQLSTTSDTVFIKSTTSKTSEVKFSDLAIGDYIVGMGIKNGNKVLEAKRVLITSAPGEIKRRILYGKVVSSTSKIISFETFSDQKNYSITYDKNTDFLIKKGDKTSATKIANVEDGKDIAIIFNTLSDKGDYLARTVIVLRNLPTP